MANNISYANRKREAQEWRRRYEELVRNLPEGERIALLDKAESAPTKRSKQVRGVYNEIVDALNTWRIRAGRADKAPHRTHNGANEALGLLLSDLHIGKYSEMDGKPVYNVEIAARRLRQVAATTRHLYNDYIRGSHKIDTFHLFLGGDIIDGEQIYPAQAWGLEMPIVDQLIEAARLIGDELIAWASANFANVYIHSVQGNHGEVRDMTGNQMQFHRSTNFDNIIALMLESGARNLRNVHFDIGMDEFHVVKIPRHGKGADWTFMMAHKVPANRTMSGTLNAKFGMWWERYQFDVFLTGHWHHWNTGEWQGRPVIWNGCLFGSDDTYTAGLGFNGFPSQTLFAISDHRPISFIWPIELEK